jgi:hypothetical protein
MISKLIHSAYHRTPIVGVDGFDIIEAAHIFASPLQLFTFALEDMSLNGSVLESGVPCGTTINHIAAEVAPQGAWLQ